MIKDEVHSLEEVQMQAAVGKETGSMYSYDAIDQHLEFDDASIHAFDAALGAVGEELREVGNPSLIQRLLRKLLRVEPEPTDGREESVYYGCYFGELLVRHHGWAWVCDPELGYVIQKAGKKVQPDVYVLRRLTTLEQGMMVRVYHELAALPG